MNQSTTLKAVIVTGASTGIGNACALHLDKLGYQVFACVRKQVDAQTLQSQASERMVQLYLDVTKPETITSAAGLVEVAVGEAGLAGLVNNAGIAVGGPLEFLPITELRRQLEINVIGQIAVTQAFLPLLRLGRGRIVNMGSISGRVATPFLGPYAASKFALGALNDALRVELRPWGIEVCLIEPGAVDTPIWDKSLSAAEEATQTWPPEVFDLYGQAMAAVRQGVVRTSRSAAPVDEVIKAVMHALTANHPKTRYLVGRGVGVAALLAKILPDRIRDRLITQQRGL
ncbi:MAG: SDR family NAD(P)-dependent oxidoreductase [Anaerolineae bacterium]|nr:SDR family NAD(P)-dependent oxidoreductase [Anaerolineae bacterium]